MKIKVKQNSKLYNKIIDIPIVNEIMLRDFINRGYSFDDLMGWR